MQGCQHNWGEIPGSGWKSLCGCTYHKVRCTKCGEETDTELLEADGILGDQRGTQKTGNKAHREKDMNFVVKCPHCHGKLTDPDRLIGDRPGVKVNVQVRGDEGTIWLSSSFGDLQFDSGDIVIPKGEVVTFFCPHCEEKISNGGSGNCHTCQSPMATLEIVTEVGVCCKEGCPGHKVGGNFGPYGPVVSGF